MLQGLGLGVTWVLYRASPQTIHSEYAVLLHHPNIDPPLKWADVHMYHRLVQVSVAPC